MSNLDTNLKEQKQLFLDFLNDKNYEKLRQLVFTDSHYDPHRLYKGIFDFVFSHNNTKLREFLTDSIVRESKSIDVKPDENNTIV